MSPEATDRPQDAGRPHRAKRRISERNRAILGVYQDVMREELRGLINLLHERSQPLNERSKTWDLAIKLARELGADLEEPTKLHPPAAVNNGPAAVSFD